MFEHLPGIVRDEPLAKHTTFKIGGPADYFISVKTKDQMVEAILAAREAAQSCFILGKGSNLLVADAGIRGLVISVETNGLQREGDRVTADAGVSMGRLGTWTVSQGLRGAEFTSGIPGSIGGSIRGNAGAMGGELKDIIICVEALDESGQRRLLVNRECQFGYRDSIFKHSNLVVLSAMFQLREGGVEEGQALLKEYWQKRNATQDYSIPSAGCMFKNPEGLSAGKLIDDLGLKGFQIGDAKVSPMHANFITNVGEATASQARELIETIRLKVRERYQLELETEVQLVGFE